MRSLQHLTSYCTRYKERFGSASKTVGVSIVLVSRSSLNRRKTLQEVWQSVPTAGATEDTSACKEKQKRGNLINQSRGIIICNTHQKVCV